MRLAKKYILSLILFLMIISAPLVAAYLEATYEEELDTTIYESRHFAIESTGFPAALHVGKLTIRARGRGSIPFLWNLRLDRSGNFGGGVEYWLKASEIINNESRLGAQLIAKIQLTSYMTRVKTINWATGEDVLFNYWDPYYVNYPFEIDFYLGIRNVGNIQNANGVGFQFERASGSDLGYFKLKYSDKRWNTANITIPFGSSTAPLPFFATNYNEPNINQTNTNYLNGNSMNTTVYVSLSVEQEDNESTISLLDASGTSLAKVGQARLTLSGYESSSVPGVILTFTDGNGSPDTNFRLKHNEIPSFIPFSLYLGGARVDNGSPITWDNLVYGCNNLRDLEVGGINYQNATSKMGGSYSDTIYVNITPIDSNLVGL